MARKKHAAAGADAPKYRWRDAESGRRRGRRGGKRSFLGWKAYAGFALLLLAVFVVALIPRKRSTPVIAIAVTEYTHPVPLNAWAAEDRQGLLDLKDTLSVDEKLPNDWKSLAGALAKQGADSAPLIISLSMHGVIDDDGNACLLPATALPLKSEGWVKVESLLQQIKESVPADRNKLLILDCNRILTNWSLGILYNSFSERLEEAIKRENVPNLAVMTAAGPGQRNWASGDLGGSSFGKFLQLGLAGAADGDGNGVADGKVSLGELDQYLKREVNRWTKWNRGEEQIPTLLGDTSNDFHVTYVGKRQLAALLADIAGDSEKVTPSVKPGEIAGLWSELNNLSQYNPLKYDPLRWSDLQQRLLWLEQAAEAGGAYELAAKREFEDLRKKLEEIDKRASGHRNSLAWLSHWSIFSKRAPDAPDITLHTLPLCEYFGQVKAAQSEEIRSILEGLLDSDVEPEAVLNRDSKVLSLGATHFLLASRRQDVVSLWKDRPQVLSEALQLRQRSARLAVPSDNSGRVGDERAHYFVRSVLETADAIRWKLEDNLFVGESNAPQQLDSSRNEVISWYDKSESIANQAAEALAERDRACAELPYLARWLWAPSNLLKLDESNLDESTRERLLELVAKTHLLADAVCQPTVVDKDSELPFVELAEEVTADRKYLRELFTASWEDLIDHGVAKTGTLGKLQAVLEVPLIPPDKRKVLLDLKAGVATALHQEYRELGSPASTPSGRRRQMADELENTKDKPESTDGKLESDDDEPENTVASDETPDRPSLLDEISKQHPVAVILNLSRGSLGAGAVESLEKDGQRVRRILANMSTLESSKPRSDAPLENAVLEHRRQICSAEHQIRAAASIGVQPSSEPNAISHLRDFDLQQLLLWHRRHVIDACWGSPVAADLIGSEEPFYVVAADSYLQAADAMLEKEPKPVLKQIARQDETLNKRKDASIVLDPNSEEVLDDRISVSIDARPSSDATEFPPGYGAVFLRDGNQRLADLKLEPLTLPFDKKNFRLDLTPERARLLGSKLHTVAFFRDHRIPPKTLVITPFEGVGYEYEPHRYKETSIQLDGDRPQGTSFILVLDCSQSMKNPIREGEDPSKTKPRLELAKEHLTTMLNEMVTRDDTRIGAFFFGHRVGYSITSGAKLEQDDWPRKFSKRLTPQKDVEMVLSFGRFEGTEAKQVKDLLGPKLKAWGESPLYLSMVQALKEFKSKNPRTRNGIIAITDGLNYQSGGVDLTTKQQVLNEWNNLDVRIHFLDFGGKKVGQNLSANEDFKEIAKKTGGVYQLVTSGRDLLNRLRERLDLDGYIVEDAEGNAVSIEKNEYGDPKPTRLTYPVDIPSQLLPAKFVVKYQRVAKEVDAEGGEAIRLLVNQEGTDIRAIPYDQGVVEEGGVVRRQDGPADHLFRVHRPIRKRDDDAVQFKVSLQARLNVSHFTYHPKETWLEITPVANSQTVGDTHVFYDTNFELREPVPVLRWDAKGWPREANHARIEFWCKHQHTVTESTIPLAAVKNAVERFKEFQRDLVKSSPGVAFRIKIIDDQDDYRVHVAEQHDRWSPIRVRFQTHPEVVPIRVRHRFDRRAKFATHEFFFSAKDKQKIEDYQESAVKVATRDAVLDGAWRLEQALEASVSEEGGLLPIGSTSPGSGQAPP